MVQTLVILGRNGKAMAAADAAPVPLGARDPFGESRHVAFSDAEGFAAGHVRWDGEAVVECLPHAEVVVVAAGALEIARGTAERIVRPGEAVVLPRDLKATIAAGSGTVWFFCTMSDGASVGEDPSPIRLDQLAERAPSPSPTPEVRIGPAPQCRSLRHAGRHLCHTYASLQLAAGANIKYLSQQIEHASVQITLDRYSHLMKSSHPVQAAWLSSLPFEVPTRANVVLTKYPRSPKKTVKEDERPIAATNA